MSKKNLNKNQEQAILHTGKPLLIVAGAGTGKTTVITQKIAHIIESGKAQPEEILALTFTEKAAEEMQTRIDTLIEIGGYLDLTISTFHGFCQRLLDEYGHDLGLPRPLKLFTETESWLLIKKHLADFNLSYYRPLGNPAGNIHELLKHFSKCKDELITPEAYVAYAESETLNDDTIERQERDRITEIAHAYHKYNRLLLQNNAVDFGDLIFYAVVLLETRPHIQKELQRRYRYILVDEFQDVNYAQYKLIKLLASGGPELSVVGDDDQAVYSFRGANVANILRFKDDFPNAESIVLSENYRSHQEILDAAYQLIQYNNPDRLEAKLNINKRLTATKKEGPKSLSRAVIHFHEQTLDDEVSRVIKTIEEIQKHEPETSWNDFAILVRANSHVDPFLRALEAAHIPYEYMAARGLFREPVVLDAMSFLRVVDGYHESAAIFRLLRMPHLGFSENDLQKFTAMAKKKAVSYYEALKRASEFHLSEEGIAICSKLLHLIHEGMRRARNDHPTAVLYHFFEEAGYLLYLTHEETLGNQTVIRQIYHLKSFFDLIAAYETTERGASVSGLVEYLSYILESGDEGKINQPDEATDSVNVLTVHGAKGLEFRYVFIVNLVEDRFPTRRRGDGIALPAELIHENLGEGDDHMEEERRLMYVAMTRAKEKLYLLSSSDYGGTRAKKPSRFLVELGLITSAKEKQNKESVLPKVQTKNSAPNPQTSYELPRTFSYSQIKTYEVCPYQYKLAHLLKIPTKGHASLSFGQSMHRTLQLFFERVQEMNRAEQPTLFDVPSAAPRPQEIQVPTIEELYTLYAASFIDDWYENAQQKEQYRKKGKEILTLFYTSHENNWNVPVSLEGWFKISIGGALLSGRIDRVDQLSDGSLEIIDYKTGKSKETVTGDDKDQLLLYQIAAEAVPAYAHVGKVSKLTFYYLNDNIRTSFVGNNKDIERLKEKLSVTIERIRGGQFLATPSVHTCTYCNYRDICEFRM